MGRYVNAMHPRGEYLAAGSPIVTVVRIHPLRLRLAVPERVAADVRIGQLVHVKVEGDRAIYHGQVARLSPAISEEDRTLLVEAEVPNENGQYDQGRLPRPRSSPPPRNEPSSCLPRPS